MHHLVCNKKKKKEKEKEKILWLYFPAEITFFFSFLYHTDTSFKVSHEKKRAFVIFFLQNRNQRYELFHFPIYTSNILLRELWNKALARESSAITRMVLSIE